MKSCSSCKVLKITSEFHVDKGKSDGLASSCKQCQKERLKQRYEMNREEYVLKNKKWRSVNGARQKQIDKEWADKNKDKIATNQRRYKEKNRDKVRARWKARRKRVRQATPSWVNLQQIELIYLNCPEGFHVDHIIPIQGKNVSGLHVPWNLQYLPAKINLKKSNKFSGVCLMNKISVAVTGTKYDKESDRIVETLEMV